MTLKRLAGLLLLAAIAVSVLLASVPARILSLAVPENQMVLSGLTGTVWHGRAARCMLRLPQGYLHLGAVQWSLSPASLLTLAPRLSFESEWGAQRLEGVLILRGTRSVDIADFTGRFSVDLVRQFAPLAIDGDVSAQIESLSLRGGLPYSAQGRLVWERGGFLSPRGRIPLGTYALDFSQPAGEGLSGTLVTVDGDLLVQGTVGLTGRDYSIDITLGSDSALDPPLQEALSLMAAPDGDQYRIQLDASF